ncbi:Bacteriophage lambda head decoration protein D [Desulfocurvibacter africanus PCS]|uniref:Bacteriophage lambda head decoration protein D n=1 Tax=Desulfocurvibacter africanus PCS TaxID=1262666 RepID=M5Q1J5_DESAF|nr:head decoration protein [Desulfocurvibacter africanus]EMG36608.1 Bacteriophage lambda head decoration protein D [Desulfocurvibacter africanus PCS]
MGVITEQNYLSDLLKWEEDSRYSRDAVIIASGNTVALGQVLGKIAATGKFVPLNPGADPADGSEKAFGIAIDAYDASAADVEGVAIKRDAIVAPSALIWPDGITVGQKAAALAELEALGIITREEA